MANRAALIAKLSQDLAPVKRAPNVNLVASAWFMVSAIYVVAIIHIFGPIRPGAFAQLSESPRFLFEMLLGLVAIYWLSLQAFRDAVPGVLSQRFMMFGFGLMLLWWTQYVIGLAAPALEPSSLGVRHFCLYETMLYSIPPIYFAWYLVRRFYPLKPMRTAISLSLAAGMMPAFYMQFACMYAPAHTLKFHIAPGLVMMLVGIGLAWRWRPDQQVS
ncbi:NrsF family protein [Thalassotalea sp. G2M2-11]|uniref:NrsF family protein n=1 Tax=Thalassotalea sp. G2M2-11 TaxID=2787627 RepID=UPI0019D0760C|nr:NrsF family protein [Thalassotalea sp. G2M2-11]